MNTSKQGRGGPPGRPVGGIESIPSFAAGLAVPPYLKFL